MSNSQAKLQNLTEDFQDLQKSLQETVAARQKLESQLHETRSVKEEFAKLDDDSNIYKLVGPVLMKQEKSEAKLNVDKRLELIESQLKGTEEKIKKIQEDSEKKKVEILRIQQELQQAAQGAAPVPPV